MKVIKCVSTILLVLNFALISVAGETITIASNSNTSPGWSAYSKHNGFVLHIAAEAFLLMGVQSKVEWYSAWLRAYEQTRLNEVDSTCCWFFVEERTKDFYYSDPVVEEAQVFIHLKSLRFDWETVDDLRGIKIGGNTGFHYGDAFEEAEKTGKISVDRARSYEHNLKKLLVGRTQIYPAARITVYDHMRNPFPPETVDLFTFHPKPLLKKQLHLLISKKMERNRAMYLIDSFNQGLQRLKENGTYDKILKDAETGVYDKMDQKWKPL